MREDARVPVRRLPRRSRHRPVAEIDRARFDLWLRQVIVDAAAGKLAHVSGDVAILEWIRDRIAHTFDPVDLTRVDTRLEQLRGDAGRQGAGLCDQGTARVLREVLAAARPAG